MVDVTYASRVTVDIDSHFHDWQLRAIRAYYALKRAADDIEVRISASGEGIHLVGWFDGPLTQEQKSRLRRSLLDDTNRIDADAERGAVGHTTNVLWTEKGGEKADKDFDDIHDALAHITLSKPAGDRLAAAVKAGTVF